MAGGTKAYGAKPDVEGMGTLGNYLRARRKQWQMSQKELAFLLGYKNESIVSRLERQERALSFDTLRACSIIFGSGAEDMFPALSREADSRLVQRIQELRFILENSVPSKRTEAKLRLLDAALSRLTEEAIEQETV
jgi:transcriptional regulator with XRE-family HTH domain